MTVTGLGVVGGDRLTIGNYIDLPLNEVERVWKNGLSEAMGSMLFLLTFLSRAASSI